MDYIINHIFIEIILILAKIKPFFNQYQILKKIKY